MKYWLSCLLILSTQMLTAQKVQSLASYYFPVEELAETKVYIYQKENNGKKEYWQMRTFQLAERTMLETKVYADNFFLMETSTENLTDEEAEMSRLILCAKDKDQKSKISHCLVFENQIFPFTKSNQPSIFEFMTQSSDPADLWQRNTRKINHQNLKKYSWQDQEKNCVEVSEKMEVGFVDDSNEVVGAEIYNRKHLYCEGLGKVSTRSRGNNNPKHIELKEIISQAQFEELRKKEKMN